MQQISEKSTKPRVWGEYVAHDHCSKQNIVNAVLCALALLPSIVIVAVTYKVCATSAVNSFDSLWGGTCTLSLSYPIAFANVLFFVNVSFGFWVIGLIQRNFWLIDPYWTLLPPLLAVLYKLNPLSTCDDVRSIVSLALIMVWSSRLTWSYFRREEWKFGQREDWRYTKMAEEHPRWWWLLSFFAVGVAQQPMLIGISLPAFSVHRSNVPWWWLDDLATIVCVSGLTIAYFADTQLATYMNTPAKERRLVLDTGLWRYSRHPNYFGETVWWLGFGCFACSVGQWYMLCGWLLNTGVLLHVTTMTESRMLQNRTGDRLEAFRDYCKATSCWIPLPPAPVTAATTIAGEEASSPILGRERQ